MVLVEWTDAYSVGIPHIDEQHQRWLEMINLLHSAMLLGEADDVVSAVLLDVWDYTRTHFSDEEALMEKYGFPGFKGHKRVHDFFIRQLKDLMAAGPDGRLTLTISTFRSMRQWLMHHIQGMDQHYAQFLRQHLANEPVILDEGHVLPPLPYPVEQHTLERCPTLSLWRHSRRKMDMAN